MTKILIRSHNTILNRRQLFRSTLAKRFTISVAIVVTVVVGAQVAKLLGYETYGIGLPSLPSFMSRGQSDEATEEIQPTNVEEAIGDSSGGDATPTSPVTSASPSSNTAAPRSGATAGGGSTGTTAPSPKPTTACSNAAIPAAACTTLLSVETSGAKNNPNVAVDTSQLPDGTVFKFDQPSWAQSGGSATINATATFGSYIYNLSLTLTEASGWKITNYVQR